MKITTPPRRALKKEAKLAKAFLVLVKRKLQRAHACRQKNFNKLMALVFNASDGLLAVAAWHAVAFGNNCPGSHL